MVIKQDSFNVCRCCAAHTSPVFGGLLLGHNIDYFDCSVCGYVQTETPFWLERAYADAINDSDTGIMARNQANARIVEAAAKTLQIPDSKVFMNLQHFGNTSAASIPIAMCEAIEQGAMCPGDNVALCGFGAGLTWGSAIFQWGIPAVIPATNEWRAAIEKRNQRSQNSSPLVQPQVVGAST